MPRFACILYGWVPRRFEGRVGGLVMATSSALSPGTLSGRRRKGRSLASQAPGWAGKKCATGRVVHLLCDVGARRHGIGRSTPTWSSGVFAAPVLAVQDSVACCRPKGTCRAVSVLCYPGSEERGWQGSARQDHQSGVVASRHHILEGWGMASKASVQSNPTLEVHSARLHSTTPPVGMSLATQLRSPAV